MLLRQVSKYKVRKYASQLDKITKLGPKQNKYITEEIKSTIEIVCRK